MCVCLCVCVFLCPAEAAKGDAASAPACMLSRLALSCVACLSFFGLRRCEVKK